MDSQGGGKPGSITFADEEGHLETVQKRINGSEADYGSTGDTSDEDSTAEQRDRLSALQKRPTGKGGRPSLADTTSIASDESGIPIPIKLRPFIKRLEADDDLSDEEIMDMIFIVRVADAMLQVGYATFLTRSFVEDLRTKLGVPELEMEIEISATRWSYQQGSVMTYNRYSSSYDGFGMQGLSRIALAASKGTLEAKEGLKKIQDCQELKGLWKVEKLYRDFPGRIIVMALLSSTGSVVFFGGTWIDLAVCFVSGGVAGFIQYLCSSFPQLSGVEETLAAMVAAILATLSLYLFEGSVCFPAQVLGTLLSNLYGISFILSLYEITQNLVMTGLARFCVATLKTFVLAFGVVVGVWISRWAGPDRLQKSIASDACENLNYAVDPKWFNLLFPLLSAGSLMQLQVSPKHWPICLLTQYVAVQFQYLLTKHWEQPVFVSNFIPAFISTLVAHTLLVTSHKLGLTQMTVETTAFFTKKVLPHQDVKERLAPKSMRNVMTAPSNMDVMRYVDRGWAEGHDLDARRNHGYRRSNRYHHQRGDLWFVLIPSIYLLVPGAMIWRLAFFSIVDSSSSGGDGSTTYNFQNLAAGILVVGVGLVVGFRFGFAAIWGITAIRHKLCLRTQHPDALPESVNVPRPRPSLVRAP